MAKKILLKLIKADILSIDTYEQDMIEFVNDNKKFQNKYIWNHFKHIPMQSLLGANHSLPLFHMAKTIIWLEEKK